MKKKIKVDKQRKKTKNWSKLKGLKKKKRTDFVSSRLYKMGTDQLIQEEKSATQQNSHLT